MPNNVATFVVGDRTATTYDKFELHHLCQRQLDQICLALGTRASCRVQMSLENPVVRSLASGYITMYLELSDDDYLALYAACHPSFQDSGLAAVG